MLALSVTLKMVLLLLQVLFDLQLEMADWTANLPAHAARSHRRPFVCALRPAAGEATATAWILPNELARDAPSRKWSVTEGIGAP